MFYTRTLSEIVCDCAILLPITVTVEGGLGHMTHIRCDVCQANASILVHGRAELSSYRVERANNRMETLEV